MAPFANIFCNARRAYDALPEAKPSQADRDYLRLLHMAASGSEANVERVVTAMLERGVVPTFDVVREELAQHEPEPAPAFEKVAVNLAATTP